MPANNGTGPNGQGPLTGRGLGTCGTQKYQPLQTNRPLGRRFFRRGGGRRSVGQGRGRGYGFFSGGGFVDEQPTKEEEVNFLKSQALRLETALEEINTQINHLETPEE